MQGEWRSIDSAPENAIVRTKIQDADGPRNDCNLKRMGRLWFLPDGGMYVYYRPTHWMPSESKRKEDEHG